MRHLVYKYKDFLKIYKFRLKNKDIIVENFHKIILKNASILIFGEL